MSSGLIEIDLWTFLGGVASATLTVLGLVVGVLRHQGAKNEKALDARFAHIEAALQNGMAHWDACFTRIETRAREETGQWQRVERDLLKLQADLPLQYVRREDYIRGQSVIEAKLDALYSKLETVQIKGAQHHG